MALGKVANYIKNLGKSVIYASEDVGKKIAPTTVSYIETNAELAKNIAYAIRDFRGSFNKAKTYIESSKVYEAGKIYKQNLFEDLASGNFYNKERENSSMNEVGKAFGMDLDFDDSDFGDLDKALDMSNTGEEDELSSGDKAIVASNEATAKASANTISRAVLEGAKHTADISKANTGVIFAQNERLFGRLNAGIDAVQAGINNLSQFNTTAMATHLENSTKFFDVMTKNSQEQTAMLKELLEMKRNEYKEKQKATEAAAKLTERKKRTTYGDLVDANGAVSLSSYFGEVNKNIQNLISEQTGGMLKFGDDSDGNMLAALATNPLSFIPTTLVNMAIGPKVRAALKKFDRTLSGVFGTIMGRLSGIKRDSDASGFAKLVARIFGVNDSLQTTINTAKYNKGAVPFDGVTRKAIVEVIPTLLAKIESAITGRDEKVFDYDEGKWTTGTKLQQNFKRYLEGQVNAGMGTVASHFKSALTEGKVRFANGADERAYAKDLQAFLTTIYRNGGYFNPNAKKLNYHDYGVEKEANFKSFVRMYKQMAKDKQMMVAGEVLEKRNQQNAQMEQWETSGHVNSQLFNNRNFSENIKVDKDGNILGKSKELAELTKDSYGNDSLFYLRNILKETTAIRLYSEHGLTVGGGGGYPIRKAYRKGNANTPFKVNMDELILPGSTTKKETVQQKLAKEIDNYDKRYRETNEKYRKLHEAAIEAQKKGKTFNKEDIRTLLYGDIEHEDENAHLMGAASLAATKAEEERELKESEEETGELYKFLFSDPYKEAQKSLQEELDPKDINGTFKERFSKAKTLSGKWSVLVSSLGNLVEKPSNYIASKLTAASNSIYDFLFERETELSPGQKVKGFFNAMTAKMTNAFDKLVNSIDDKIITPVRDKLGLYSDKLAEVTGWDWFKKNYGDATVERTKSMFKSFGDFTTNNLGKFADLAAETVGLANNEEDTGEAGKKAPNILEVLKGKKEAGEIKADPQYKKKPKNIRQKAKDRSNAKKKAAQSGTEQVANAIKGIRAKAKERLEAKKLAAQTTAQNAEGTRYVNKTGLTTISEGEMIIPSELNPFNPNRGKISKQTEIRNEKNIANQYSKLLSDSILKNIGMNAGGTVSVEDTSAKNLNVIKNLRNRAFASANHFFMNTKNTTAKTAYKDFKDNSKVYVPEGLAGGALGGVLGLVTGLGPMAGLVIGAGAAIARKSNIIQDWLFGEEVSEEEGGGRRGGALLSRKQQQALAKFMPDFKMFGTTGAVAGLLGLTPFGILGGLGIGAMAAYAKNNSKFSDFMFGEETGIINAERKEWLKKKFPGMAIGTAATFALGPFGLLGSAIVGSTAGILATNERFKNVILGNKTFDGKRTGGLVSVLKTNFTDPLANFAKSLSTEMMQFLKEDIMAPLAKGVGPLLQGTGVILKSIGSAIGKGVKSLFGGVGLQFSKYLEYYAAGPMRKFLGATVGRGFNWAKQGAKSVISAPFKFVEKAGNRAQAALIRGGHSTDMTADQRIGWMAKHGYGYNGDMGKLDQAIVQMDDNALDTAMSALTLLEGKENFDQFVKAGIRDLNYNISRFIPDPQRTNYVVKLLRSNDPKSTEEALEIISKEGNFTNTYQRDSFLKYIQKAAAELNRNQLKQGNTTEARKTALADLNKIKGFEGVTSKNYKKYLKVMKVDYDKRKGWKDSSKELPPEQQLLRATEEGNNAIVDVLSQIRDLLNGSMNLTHEQIYSAAKADNAGNNYVGKVIYGDKVNRKNTRNILNKYYPNAVLNKKQRSIAADMNDNTVANIITLAEKGMVFNNLDEAFSITNADTARLLMIYKALPDKGKIPKNLIAIKKCDDSIATNICAAIALGVEVNDLSDFTKFDSDKLQTTQIAKEAGLDVNKSYDEYTVRAIAQSKGIAVPAKTKAKSGSTAHVPSIDEISRMDGEVFNTDDGKGNIITKKQVKLTDYGAMTYIMSTDGSLSPDMSDQETKEAIERRDAAAKAMERNADATEKSSGILSSIFGSKKANEKEKNGGEGFLSKLFGGAKSKIGGLFGLASGVITGFGSALFKMLGFGGKVALVAKAADLLLPHAETIVTKLVEGITGLISTVMDLGGKLLEKSPELVSGVFKGLKNGLFGKPVTNSDEIKQMINSGEIVQRTKRNIYTGEEEVYYVDKKGNKVDVETNDKGEITSIGTNGAISSIGWKGWAVGAGYAGYKAYQNLDKIKAGAGWLGNSKLFKNSKVGKYLRMFGGESAAEAVTGDPKTDAMIAAQTQGSDRIVNAIESLGDKIAQASGLSSLNDAVEAATGTNPSDIDIDTKTGKKTPKKRGRLSTLSRKAKVKGLRAGRAIKGLGGRVAGAISGFGANAGARATTALTSASTTVSTNTGAVKEAISSLASKLSLSGKKTAILTKLATKLGPKLAFLGATNGVGLVWTIGSAVAAYVRGASNPEEIFNVPEGTPVSTFDKFIAGASCALSELTLGIVEPQTIAAMYTPSAQDKEDEKVELASESGETESSSTSGSFMDFLSEKASAVVALHNQAMGNRSGAGKFGRGYFKQTDSRYASMRFNIAGDSIYQNMYDSGCGPVAAVNALAGRGNPDPVEAANFALKGGYKEKDGGTKPDFFRSYFNAHGKDADFTGSSGIMDNLKRGNSVVLMGQSNKIDDNTPYGTGPHYVTATGLDGRGNMIIQDPQDNRSNLRFRASDVLSKTKFGVAAKNKYGRAGRYTLADANNIKSSTPSGVADFRKTDEKSNAPVNMGTLIFNTLTEAGLSKIAVAGIMGNMYVESQLDPRRVQGEGYKTAKEITVDGETGYGLCQWTYRSRQENLANYAKECKSSSSNPIVQLRFMLGEMGAGMVAKLNACKSTDEATVLFCNDFERPGVPHSDARKIAAKKAYETDGAGLTNLTYRDGEFGGAPLDVDFTGGVVAGGGGGTDSSGGFLGFLGQKAGVLTKLYNSIFGGDSSLFSSSGSSSGSFNVDNYDGGPLESKATTEGVNQAFNWVKNQKLDKPGYGNNGCTAFVKDFLTQTGNPIGKNLPLWVPTIYQAAKKGNIVRTPTEGARPGDVAIIETNHNPGDGPDHVVIADGKGGYYGNSSSRNMVVHGDLGSDFDAKNIVGYVGTGDPSATATQATGELGRSQEEVIADSGTSAKGKYGRGKYSRPVAPKTFFGRGPATSTPTVANNIIKETTSTTATAPVDYSAILQEILKALLMIVANTSGNTVDASNANIVRNQAEQRSNAINRLKTGLQQMNLATSGGSGNGIGPVSPNTTLSSLMQTMISLATK